MVKMGFKVFVLGLGAQGRVISYLLDKSGVVDELRVGDIQPDSVKGFVDGMLDNASLYKVDASKMDEVIKAAKGVDVIVNAVLPSLNINVLKAALQSGSHYIDLAFAPPYDNFDRMLKYNDEFVKEDLIALTAMGLTPGTSNILAAYAADELDEVDVIKIGDAEVVDSDIPISTWSPETLVSDCLEEDTYVYDNGELRRMLPFSGMETVDLPRIGRQRLWIHAHEEQITLWRYIDKDVRHVEFRIGGSGIEFLYNLYKFGLLSMDPVDVNGAEVSPLDIYLRVVPKPPTSEEIRKYLEDNIIKFALEVVYVYVRGVKNGELREYTSYVFSPDPVKVAWHVPPANYSSYVISAANYIMTRLIGEGKVDGRGVIPPEALSREVRRSFIEAHEKWLAPPIEIEINQKIKL